MLNLSLFDGLGLVFFGWVLPVKPKMNSAEQHYCHKVDDNHWGDA